MFSVPGPSLAIPAVFFTSTSIPFTLLDVEIDRPSKGYESTSFSCITLTLELSPKIFGLLTTVEAWPGAVI